MPIIMCVGLLIRDKIFVLFSVYKVLGTAKLICDIITTAMIMLLDTCVSLKMTTVSLPKPTQSKISLVPFKTSVIFPTKLFTFFGEDAPNYTEQVNTRYGANITTQNAPFTVLVRVQTFERNY